MADPLRRDRQRLLHLCARKLSFERRSVTLASGHAQATSTSIAGGRSLTAEGHFLIGRLLLDLIRVHAPEARAVGGMTLGADPLASAVSLTSYLGGQPLSAFLVRKEPKGHGTGQWIEGRTLLVKGDQVAIVDDVVTTGGSTLKAIERVREEGLVPVVALALVDRSSEGAGKDRGDGRSTPRPLPPLRLPGQIDGGVPRSVSESLGFPRAHPGLRCGLHSRSSGRAELRSLRRSRGPVDRARRPLRVFGTESGLCGDA